MEYKRCTALFHQKLSLFIYTQEVWNYAMKVSRQTLSAFFAVLFYLNISSAARCFASNKPSQPDIDQVMSLFKSACYSCHSSQQQMGGLRLDSREALLKGGGRGPAITSAHPDQSLLIKAINYSDKTLQMPPGGKLSTAQIDLITEWIKSGAKWPDLASKLTLKPHWAFLPLKKPGIPAVKNKHWIRTPIDAFILSTLEKSNITPSSRADRRTLIRRAAYDLTGLPPTPSEMERFLKDSSANAYNKLIDRLLDSPRYGERWGRHWLDIAHYGDTHGYDKDTRRDNAWPYRDYVISAFNSDKPYSRFIEEQIAGDVLFPTSPQALIATGFVAAGPWDVVGNLELKAGTVEREKTRLLDRDDMAANTFATFESMTVHCARCHDHKFDPIPQRDYYKLQAVFSGVERGDRAYESAERMQARSNLQIKLETLTKARGDLQKKVDNLSSPEQMELDNHILSIKTRLNQVSINGTKPSETNGYHSEVSSKAEDIKWVQIDLGSKIPIRSILLFPARPVDFRDTPGFGFPVRFRIETSNTSDFLLKQTISDCTNADFKNLGDTPFRVEFPIQACRYVRITALKLWQRDNDFVFALGEVQIDSNGKNAAIGAAVTAKDSIEQGRWSAEYLVDGYDSRLSLPDYCNPQNQGILLQKLELGKSLNILMQQREIMHAGLVSLELSRTLDNLSQSIDSTTRALNSLPKPNQVFALVPHSPRPIWVLKRGDVEQHGEQVQPGALSCFPGLNADFSDKDISKEGARRASLAKWISSPRNMLTWRSIVNRVWHYHFGKGIVDTPNDFGKNGSLPTHPELLDWLAVYFLEHGQSLKQLHRIIMQSAVYMQSSESNLKYEKLDSDNRLLWRMNRLRLDAEEIRDSVLADSGTLNLKMGGPGYEVFKYTYDYSPRYDHFAMDKITSPAGWRRAVYCFQVRSVQNPFLECLDCADPNINTPVRNTTLTALQALTLWNDPFMIQQSEIFADKLQKQSPFLNTQIQELYRTVLGRKPSASETIKVSEFAKLRGMANTCRLLFNTNEFLFID